MFIFRLRGEIKEGEARNAVLAVLTGSSVRNFISFYIWTSWGNEGHAGGRGVGGVAEIQQVTFSLCILDHIAHRNMEIYRGDVC